MLDHIPVLPHEALEIFAPKDGDRILDVTLGLGGHATAFLAAGGPTSTLIGLDADSDNLSVAQKRLSAFKDRVTFIHSNFSLLPDCLPERSRQFDIIFADLGISSPHLDDPSRGFSFRSDAPLDMRFDRTSGQAASMCLASLDRLSLIDIFKNNGEIRQAHRLVDAIIEKRKVNPVRTTFMLRDAVIETYGRLTGQELLPQVFQALRIAVNGELRALDTLLATATSLLAPSGRFGIITFHSLEDRVVKNVFRRLTTPEKDPVTGAKLDEPEFSLLSKKSLAPSEHEITQNPRSRSARLRAIRKQTDYTTPRF
jgi:16S rRNA (cytosine1402-N4)-methyltransferase